MSPDLLAASDGLADAATGQHVMARTLATDMAGPRRLRDLAGWLTRAERDRAERLAHPLDRRDWMAARGLLRELAGQQLGLPPHQVELAADPRGKPRLLADAAYGDIDISLSHTRGLVACVLATRCQVGIDAERIETRCHADVAGAMLAPLEAAWLAARPQATATADFLRLWTLKEAVAKAQGSGLQMEFTSFSVRVEPPSLTEGGATLRPLAHWRLMQWRREDRHIVALAYRRAVDGPCSVDVLHLD